jgi:glycosyltransferase involved in cell wall biosynthesis
MKKRRPDSPWRHVKIRVRRARPNVRKFVIKKMPENKRRALIVLDRGLAVPSAMVRAVQYRPYFEKSPHWKADFVSRRSEEIDRLVSRTCRPNIPLMMPLIHQPMVAYREAWERRQEDEIVSKAMDYDLVYLVKIPHLPLYERLRALKGPKIVMEMNDGLWLPFFQTCWSDLDSIISVSDAVICENGHLADYAHRYNRSVEVVPDSPQVEVFDRWRGEIHRCPEKVVIGWIGSPENAGTMYRIFEPLEELFQRHQHLQLRVVGADVQYLPRFESVRCTHLATYNQETMIREALGFDIGIFPLFHSGDARARGTLKAMIYMSAEAAVVAEDIGENPKLIQDGVNGLLASTTAEWTEKLDWLITHAAERKAIARRGLETVRENFDASVVFGKLTAAFDRIVSG